MPREFSEEFASRLEQETIRYIRELGEFYKDSESFPGGMRAAEYQFREIMGLYIETSRTLECLMPNGKIEELQALNDLPQDIVAEEFSKLHRNADSTRLLLGTLRTMESKKKALLKRSDILREIKLTMEVIKELNTIADEEVFVQRIETENASDKTDGESTTVEEAERKIRSEVDDVQSIAGTMEKVEEFLTDGKLTTSEKQSSERDQNSIADRIEAQQQLSAVASSSKNEEIELQNRTREMAEELTQLKNSMAMLRLVNKCLGLPEEASYTDEKSKERLEKISLHFQELDALFDQLETVKKEFLEL